MSTNSIPVFQIPSNAESDETVEPTTGNAMQEIRKILYRLKWVEDKIKDGNRVNDYNLEYVTNRVRDMEGFLSVMDRGRLRQLAKGYYANKEKESQAKWAAETELRNPKKKSKNKKTYKGIKMKPFKPL